LQRFPGQWCGRLCVGAVFRTVSIGLDPPPACVARCNAEVIVSGLPYLPDKNKTTV
jgi:hypothetical protein